MYKGLLVLVLAAAVGGYLMWSGKLPVPGAKAPVAAEAAAGADAQAATSPEGGAPPAMPVSVATSIGRDITEWTEFSGRLRAAEDVQIRPRVSGSIEGLHFAEGDLVKKGDRLFTIDLRPYQATYDQAAAALDGAAARAELAGSDLERAKKLLEERAVSQREFDEKNNAHREAAAAVNAARATLALAALDLEYAEVRAPIDGRVGRPDITVGNMVQAGQAVLTTLQSIDPIYADFDMDEQTYLRLMKGMTGGARGTNMQVFMALADESEFEREGVIRSFDNQLSGDSGTLRVRAEFKNTDGVLTPGLFARIRLGSAQKTAAVLINDSAIGTEQTRKFVYVVGADGAVAYRPVSIGKLSADGLRIITEGLSADEPVVVNGLMRIRQPGMKVQPMMVSMHTLQPEGGAPAATGMEGSPPPTDPATPAAPAE